jgi:cyclic pyranopterin phosphate synthase
VGVDLEVRRDRIIIRAEAATDARTGVEMETLTAASVAASALYDMLKSVDKKMVIERVRLLSKTKQ